MQGQVKYFISISTDFEYACGAQAAEGLTFAFGAG